MSSKPGPGGVRRFVTGGSDNMVKIWDYKYVARDLRPRFEIFC